MISYQEAITKILLHTPSMATSKVPLDGALGHALAQNIMAPFDMPAFDNSAMDGFGVRTGDIERASSEKPAQLECVGVISAGDDTAAIKISHGEAVKIFTGAAIPEGVEAVVMKEYASEQNDYILLSRSAKAGENIRRQAEEYKNGALVLSSGSRITPPVIGLLANFGYKEVEVHKKPKVAVIVTGNELVPLAEDLHPGQIYDSNSHALTAALQDLGISDCTVRQARDDKVSLRNEIAQALRQSDVIITTGGISVGDYDLAKDVFADLSVDTVFWKVAIKPGRPNYFGTFTADESVSSAPARLVFGIPGNPVSALVSFHQFVRPALLKMMGLSHTDRLQLKAELACDFRKKPGRVEFVRAVVADQEGKLVVQPTQAQGSHMLGGLSEANCLICFPQDAEFFAKGQQVPIELLDWC